MKKLIKKLIWVLSLSIIVIGCSPIKNIVNKKKTDISLSKIIDSTYNGLGIYERIYVKKFSGDINYNDNNYSITGRIISDRNKRLFISVYASLGVEVIRVEIEKNNFIVFNKLKKIAYKGTLKKLTNRNSLKRRDINIEKVQDIIFAGIERGKVLFNKELNNDIEFRGKTNDCLLYYVEKTDAKVSGFSYNDGKLKIKISYKHNENFVEEMNLVYSDDKTILSANLVYEKVEFVLPNNYKQLNISDYTIVDY